MTFTLVSSDPERSSFTSHHLGPPGEEDFRNRTQSGPFFPTPVLSCSDADGRGSRRCGPVGGLSRTKSGV